MKKTKVIYLFLMLLCLFAFTGCENTKLNNGEVEETEETEYDSAYYQIIGIDEFKEIYKSSTPVIIYFGSESCSACLSFKPYAKQFAKENETMVYFYLIDNLSSAEQTELYSLVDFSYIPFVTIYQNQNQLYGEAGAMDAATLKSLAIEYGVLSE